MNLEDWNLLTDLIVVHGREELDAFLQDLSTDDLLSMLLCSAYSDDLVEWMQETFPYAFEEDYGGDLEEARQEYERLTV